MRCRFAAGVLGAWVVMVLLAGLSAQAATVAYWKFNEKAAGNPADIDPIENAIKDETTSHHDGTAFGGDPFNEPDVNVYPRYVVDPTGGNSALRMTLQDWDPAGSYVGEEEDVVLVPNSSAFDMDLSSNTTYTFEAVVRAPDPQTIMNSTFYADAFPQWYDYTDNSIISKPREPTPSTNKCEWVVRLASQGYLSLLMRDSANNVTKSNSNRLVTGGMWHQVAVKIIGSTDAAQRKVQYYIDGASAGEAALATSGGTPVPLSGVVSNTMSLYLGSFGDVTGERWSDEFIGDIDQIRISTGEVTMLPIPSNTVPALKVVHTGSTDPTTEGFRLCDRIHTESENSSTWTGVAGPPASGHLQETATHSPAYYRVLADPAQFKNSSNGWKAWTVSGTMKLGASNKPWNQCIGVEDGTTSWVLSFMDSSYVEGEGGTSTYNPGAAGAGVYQSGAFHRSTSHSPDDPEWSYFDVEKMGTVDPTGGFHTYKMQYDPVADSVTFYVDNVSVGTQTRAEAWARSPDGYTNKCRVWFGDSYPLEYNIDYFINDSASDAWWSTTMMMTGVNWDPSGDGVCGAADLDIVRSNWGSTKTPDDWAHGELTGDGTVGAADLDLIRSHWGQSVPVVPPPPGIGPVPEPSTFVLLVIGSLMLLFRRRGR